MKKQTIFTIGHSNKYINEFLSKLNEHDIELIVDIRTYPQSRYCPQFNRKRLEQSLMKNGIAYEWRGRNLGGRSVNVGYDEAIYELVLLVRKGKRICVMCSEGDYKKCHRHELLEPSFTEGGLKVKHIIYE